MIAMCARIFVALVVKRKIRDHAGDELLLTIIADS